VPLGGPPHVNFGGLTIRNGRLYAASMEGLHIIDLSAAGAPVWAHKQGGLGLDVTGVAFTGDVVWIAGRRGLVGAVQ